jgi:uncharacterized protein YndB with AHSA1/START domain
VYVDGTFLELDPGKTIVQTWTPVGPGGNTGNPTVQLRLDFRDAGNGGTLLTQTETGPGHQIPEQVAEAEEGTRMAHDALKHHLEVHGS